MIVVGSVWWWLLIGAIVLAGNLAAVSLVSK